MRSDKFEPIKKELKEIIKIIATIIINLKKMKLVFYITCDL